MFDLHVAERALVRLVNATKQEPDETTFAVLADLHMSGGRWSPIPQRIILLTNSVNEARRKSDAWISSHPHGQARLYNLDTLIRVAAEQNINLYNEDGTPFVDTRDHD